jgi:hypothetical protein
MGTRVLIAVFAAVFVTACNPFGGSEFSCTSDMQCGTGKCENGFCAFADPICPSGYRYGDLAGGMSNTCVGGTGGPDAKVFMDAHLPMDGVYCYGTGFGASCFVMPPTGSVDLTPQTFVTDASAMCSSSVMGNPPWCVIAAADITINAGLFSATGTKPLVLVATGSITVTGTLDASTKRGGQTGAGSVTTSSSLCDPGTAPGNNGGGAGGTFAFSGGTGGNGGGSPGAVKPTNAMRGGCPGEDGKSGTFGAKGFGGGAVYLIAGTQIMVTGAINASGAGGSAGQSGGGGGGGGGSGGLVGLDAPAVMSTGFIFANGGGGAEGSGNSTPGANGNESVNGAAAPASANVSNGGEGGAGGATTPAGNGTNAPTFGGGGGGGGAGAIRLFQATTIGGAGVVSPAPT